MEPQWGSAGAAAATGLEAAQLPMEGLEPLTANGDEAYAWAHHSLLNLTFMPSGYENASAFHQTEWVDVDTISITLAANVVVCLLALTYFWSSRRHYPGYFSPKRHFLPDETPPDLPSSGFLSWIPPLMAVSEDEILAYAGFDAAIFLRFYSLAFKVCAVFAPYALLVLIPVNVSGVHSSSDYTYASNINRFNRLSMSNIQHDDSRTWFHAMGMYLLTGVSMYFLVVEYRYYTNLRHRFLRRKSAHQRTIVVEGVPKEMRSDSKLFTYFNTLYPDEVVNVHMPMDLSMLRRRIRQRQAILDNLGRGLAERGIRGEEQYHYTGPWCCWRRRVNTVGFCSQELERLNLAIATEQDKRIPRRRRRLGWGHALASISSVDMSYDLGSKADREAGPIERVVLQEDLGYDIDEEDDEDCEDDERDEENDEEQERDEDDNDEEKTNSRSKQNAGGNRDLLLSMSGRSSTATTIPNTDTSASVSDRITAAPGATTAPVAAAGSVATDAARATDPPTVVAVDNDNSGTITSSISRGFDRFGGGSGDGSGVCPSPSIVTVCGTNGMVEPFNDRDGNGGLVDGDSGSYVGFIGDVVNGMEAGLTRGPGTGIETTTTTEGTPVSRSPSRSRMTDVRNNGSNSSSKGRKNTRNGAGALADVCNLGTDTGYLGWGNAEVGWGEEPQRKGGLLQAATTMREGKNRSGSSPVIRARAGSASNASPSRAGSVVGGRSRGLGGGGGGGRSGGRAGGGTARSISPKRRQPVGSGWEGRGTWTPTGVSVTPRLSVDLINVDPLCEAMKSTAQTLQNIRAHTFYYRGKHSYGTTTANTSAVSVANGKNDSNSGNKSNATTLISNGKNNYSGADGATGGASINDSCSSSGRRRVRGWGGRVMGGGGGTGEGVGESAALLSTSSTSRRGGGGGGSRMPVKRRGPRYSSRAFVTFRSFSAATVARQVLHCARPGRMAASAAPEARDVYWPNVMVTRRQHTIRRLCVEILLGALMVFFPVLVTLLSFAFSAENLMQHSAVIKDLCGRSSLFQSMVELIQPLLIISVMATLPLLLRWVGHFEGILAESMIQMQTLSRFFSFQVLNVFLVTTIAGFAVEILQRQFQAQIVQKLVNKPSLFFTLLGETLPKVCGFFCDYVIIRAFTGMSMELVRAYSLLPGILRLLTCKRKWGRSPVGSTVEARRQRFDSAASNTSSGAGGGGGGPTGSGRLWPNGVGVDGGVGVRGSGGRGGRGEGSGASSPTQAATLRRVDCPGCFFYGQVYAQDLLVVVVVMTYACVAPVVLIPALMFFAMAQVVYKHQLLYVYVPTFESGGSFFPKMFRRWIFALFTAQSTMVGMCLLKNGFNQAWCVLFLIVLTYVFKRKVRSMYEPVSFSLPLEIARGLDLDRAESGAEGQEEEDEALHPAANEYLQPELREPPFLGPEDLLSALGGNDETFGQ